MKLFHAIVFEALRLMSPPSRAAWIEIISDTNNCTPASVAAFTGGVD